MNKSNLIFVLAFGITYVLLAILMWLGFGTFDGIFSVKRTMHHFATAYDRDLRDGVFEKVYAEAKKCQSLRAPAAKQTCETQSGLHISRLLKEEELTDNNGYNWPNDLFFVKKEGEKFLQIGWDGKLKDITSSVTTNNIPVHQSFLNLLTWRGCNTFNSYVASLGDACEIYEIIPLPNNNTGYMVRVYPSVEEDMLLLYLLNPLVAFMFVKDYTYMGVHQIPYILVSFLSILLCVIVAIMAKKLYLKHITTHTKKKAPQH